MLALFCSLGSLALASCSTSPGASVDGPAITQATGNLFPQASGTTACLGASCVNGPGTSSSAPQQSEQEIWAAGTLINGYLCKVESYPFGLGQRISLLAWYLIDSAESGAVSAVLAQAGNATADASPLGTKLWVAARVLRNVRYRNAAGDVHEAALLKLVTARQVGAGCS